MHNTIRDLLVLSVFFISLSFISACELAEKPNIVTPNGDKIYVELAVTSEEQKEGLMFREELAEDAGMLFVFEDPRTMSFWMKNTLIPLDAVFINSALAIVDIQTMPPCPEDEQRCPSFRSKEKGLYALEINAGTANRLGLKPGDRLIFNLPDYDQSK